MTLVRRRAQPNPSAATTVRGCTASDGRPTRSAAGPTRALQRQAEGLGGRLLVAELREEETRRYAAEAAAADAELSALVARKELQERWWRWEEEAQQLDALHEADVQEERRRAQRAVAA
eukprot:3959950-Prymnesium_polylepis.1